MTNILVYVVLYIKQVDISMFLIVSYLLKFMNQRSVGYSAIFETFGNS